MTAAEINQHTGDNLAALDANSPWKQQLTLALTTWRDKMLAEVRAGGAKAIDIELQAIGIGDVIVLTVNGEMFSRFTDDVRKLSGIDGLFVVGYANRGYGYIPTREAYAEGGYETDTAHFFYNSFRPAPGGLELLANHAAKLVATLK